MPKEPNTLDQDGLVELLSIPEYPEVLTQAIAKRSGVFVKAKKRGRYDTVKSIRSYVKQLLDIINERRGVVAQTVGTHLGISHTYVKQLAGRGIFVPDETGKFSLKQCRIAYIKNLQEVSRSGNLTLTDQRTRLTKAQADTEELKLEKFKGTLIHTETALEIWGSILSAFRSKIEGVAVRIKPVIDDIETKGDKAAALSEIETLHKEALEELSTIQSSDYADDQQGASVDQTPAEPDDKRVGRPKKSLKQRPVKRTRKVENKKS